jgi:hypothetical protein
MYAIDSIAIIYALDDDDTEPKSGRWYFATVPDEHETNYVSPVSTRFQPDIQLLASLALLFPTPPWQLLRPPTSVGPWPLGISPFLPTANSLYCTSGPTDAFRRGL